MSEFDNFFDDPKDAEKKAQAAQQAVQAPQPPPKPEPAPSAITVQSIPSPATVEPSPAAPGEPSGQGRSTYAQKISEEPPKDFMVEQTGKDVYLFYGEKNDGKTYIALSMPGTVAALSFDYKTARVWATSFNRDARIQVYDCLIKESYDSPEAELESSKATMAYIHEILDRLKANPPDWILIDGSEIFQKVAENLMRFNNSISAFGGVQWTFWKERRFYIRQLHEKAIRIAKRGVIYTTYIEKDEIVVDGQIKARVDTPKWLDAVLYSVDEVIRTYPKTGPDGKRQYWARVDGSKLRPQSSGQEFNITGKGAAGLGIK